MDEKRTAIAERQARSREKRRAAGMVAFHRMTTPERAEIMRRIADLADEHLAFVRRLLDGLK